MAVALTVAVLAGAGLLTDHLVTEKSSPAASKIVGSKTSGQETTTSTYTRPPVGGGWLASENSWVIFLQWSPATGLFRGTAQDVRLAGTAPTLKLTSTSIPITGTVEGTSITLTFIGRPEQFGTIQGGRFTVDFPVSSGTLVPVTFVAASTAEYNHTLSKLRARVTSANIAAQEAEDRAKAETLINQAATAVLTGIGSLSAQETSLNQAVTGVKGALATVRKGLAATRSALSTVTSYDTANEVGYTANEVGYSANAVGYAVNTVKREIGYIQSGISTLRTALATLQAKEHALQGYTPPDQPASTAVTKAVSSADAAITAAVAATNQYIGQANADVRAADAIAAQAEHSQGCTTTSVTSWTPIPALT